MIWTTIKYAYTSLLIVIWFSGVGAQNMSIHSTYHNRMAGLPQTLTDPPCPWQSVRLLPYAHIQVDIRGTLEEVTSIDPLIAQRDLWRMALRHRLSAMDLIKQGYKVRYHTAFNLEEYIRFATIKEAYDPSSCGNPCGGWWMSKLPGTLDVMYAQKQNGPNDYSVSFVQFLKRPPLMLEYWNGDVIINGTFEVNPNEPVRSFIIDKSPSKEGGFLPTRKFKVE